MSRKSNPPSVSSDESYVASQRIWFAFQNWILSHCRGAGLAQWWERLPPTNVSLVQFSDSASYVGWVNVVGFLLCSETFFSGYSGFPLSSKTNISKFQFDLDYCQAHYREPVARVIAQALPVFDVKFAFTFFYHLTTWRLSTPASSRILIDETLVR